MSWISGSTIAAIINHGERKNFLSSRSTMANIRFISFFSQSSPLTSVSPFAQDAKSQPHRRNVLRCRLHLVAQLAAGVMHKDIVQRRALDRERLHLHIVVN